MTYYGIQTCQCGGWVRLFNALTEETIGIYQFKEDALESCFRNAGYSNNYKFVNYNNELERLPLKSKENNDYWY